MSTIQFMRADVEKTQKEIIQTFDIAISDPKFKVDQSTVNDVKRLFDSAELYLKSKNVTEKAIALKSDPRVQPIFKVQPSEAQRSADVDQAYLPLQPYQRFIQRNNQSYELLSNPSDHRGSFTSQKSKKRFSSPYYSEHENLKTREDEEILKIRSKPSKSVVNRIPLREPKRLQVVEKVIRLPQIMTRQLL